MENKFTPDNLIKLNDAIKSGDVKRFIEINAQLKFNGKDLDSLFNSNLRQGPLYALIKIDNSSLDFVRHLIEIGCNIEDSYDNKSPYDLAIFISRFDIAYILLDSGASPASSRGSKQELMTHTIVSNVSKSLAINDESAELLKSILIREVEAGWKLNEPCNLISLFQSAAMYVHSYPDFNSRPKGYFIRPFKTLLELGADYRVTKKSDGPAQSQLSCLAYLPDNAYQKDLVMEILEFLITEHGCEPLENDFNHPFVNEFIANRLAQKASQIITDAPAKIKQRRL